jgi:hypothetical protein
VEKRYNIYIIKVKDNMDKLPIKQDSANLAQDWINSYTYHPPKGTLRPTGNPEKSV